MSSVHPAPSGDPCSAQNSNPGSASLITVLDRLQSAAKEWDAPALEMIAQTAGRPYAVLVGTLLSLRTRDQVTLPATRRLLALADSPQTLAALRVTRIEAAIKPVAFYRTKAKQLRRIGKLLIQDFEGSVPANLDALLTLPGVGRKTANLTLGLGFRVPAVCVDVHVHRILNRLGALAANSPEETEMLLRAELPEAHWLRVNALLVPFGQTLCRPQSPFCTRCPIAELCGRVGVTRNR